MSDVCFIRLVFRASFDEEYAGLLIYCVFAIERSN